MEKGLSAVSEREESLLAPYAMHSVDSAGRRYPEPDHPYRGAYQRDRDRIIHSGAFRRLSRKTQVFTGEMGDYHRTRLTHTLEVSSIARTMARALRLNEDLVEALALAHDIGHPPFGHAGEEALDECLADHGGFNHNAQALRIFELLEIRYPKFPGLNLSSEVLEGQRHRAEKKGARNEERGTEDLPLPLGEGRGEGEPSDNNAPSPFPLPKGEGFNQSSHSALPTPHSPLLEVQLVDAADSIAYDAHDADDSLEVELLEVGQLLEVPLWKLAAERVRARFAGLDERHLRRAIVHEVIDWQVSDMLAVAEREIHKRELRSVEDVRKSPPIFRPSDELAEKKCELERFLFDSVYHHPIVLMKRQSAQRALQEMFNALVAGPGQLPPKFQRRCELDGVPRAVADYLAGMTDRYAFDQHPRLVAATGPAPKV